MSEPSYYANFPRDVRRLLRAVGSPRVANYAGRLVRRPRPEQILISVPSEETPDA